MAWKALLIVFCLGSYPVAGRSGKKIPSFAGPYKAVVRQVTNESIKDFPSTGDMWLSGRASHYRPGHNQFMWGRQFNSIEINDDLQVHLRMSSWSNNQWKRNAFVMKFNKLCHDSIQYGPTLFKLIYGVEPTQCPVQPQDREIKNQSVDIQFPPVPVFPYGRWLFTMILYKDLKVVGLFDADVETIPRL